MQDRPLPVLTDENRFFWTSGADGRLRFLRCVHGHYVHPPAPICRVCLSEELAPHPVSGRAIVRSVTVNHQPLGPAFPVPNAIAIVEMTEQEGLNLTTNIVGIDPLAVEIGMAVRVTFEAHGEIHVPLFEPAR